MKLLLVLLALGMPQTNLEAKIEVLIAQPMSLQAVFGEIDVEAEVYSDRDIDEVELFVDDRSFGTLRQKPYHWRVDVGQENIEHRFRVEARGELGNTGRATVVTPRIRVDEEFHVELQQLYVTVTRDKKRVLDLNDNDFRVFDNGRQEKTVTFARGDVPVTAVLLVDSSVSMKGERMASGLRGAEAFVSGMKTLDEAMLMLFSDQLLHATAFTDRSADLLAPLAGLEANGNTAINDHLYLAFKLLDARQGRRVVVLFTDGADLHSVLSMREVLWKAKRSQALVYWLRLEDGGKKNTSFATAWRGAPGNTAELEMLEEAVVQSGGRISTLGSVEEIEPAFRELLTELREQYVIGYYPSQVKNDDSWHDVGVKVKRPGLKVRARGGYVDF